MASFVNEWKVNIQGYSRNVRLFLWASFLFNVGMGMYMIMYNLYVRALEYDQVTLGHIIAMTSLATAIIIIPAGILSDRLGRKKVIIFGLIFTGISFIFRAILEAEGALVVTAFLTGLFSSFVMVSAIPLLSENSTKEQRVHLFSFNFGLMMIAQVVGNTGGGLLTDIFHFSFGLSELHSLRITLLIGTAISFAAIIPGMLILEKKKIEKKKTAITMETVKYAWESNRTSLKFIGLFAVAQMLIGFGAGLVIPYLNVYFADRFDASNTSIGLVVSLGQFATAIAMFIGPALVRRIGEVKAVVVLQLSSIPFLLITGFTNAFYLAAVAFLLRQALMNAGNPIQMSIMMGKVDDSMKGLANSVGQMVFMLGWACMGPVSMMIVSANGEYWGYAYVFSITACLYLIGAIYFFAVFNPKRDRNKDATEDNNQSETASS